jgi:hypothetical protein
LPESPNTSKPKPALHPEAPKLYPAGPSTKVNGKNTDNNSQPSSPPKKSSTAPDSAPAEAHEIYDHEGNQETQNFEEQYNDWLRCGSFGEIGDSLKPSTPKGRTFTKEEDKALEDRITDNFNDW